MWLHSWHTWYLYLYLYLYLYQSQSLEWMEVKCDCAGHTWCWHLTGFKVPEHHNGDIWSTSLGSTHWVLGSCLSYTMVPKWHTWLDGLWALGVLSKGILLTRSSNSISISRSWCVFYCKLVILNPPNMQYTQRLVWFFWGDISQRHSTALARVNYEVPTAKQWGWSTNRTPGVWST